MRRVSGAVILALALSACGGSPKAKECTASGVVSRSPSPSASVSPRPLIDATTAPGVIEARVTGAESFEHRVPARPLRIVIADAADIPPELRLLSVGLELPQSLPDGRGYDVGFDLLGYQGDCRYRFGPGSGAAPAAVGKAGEGVESNVFLDLFTPPGARTATRFDELRAPCTVEVRSKARVGSISCPEMAGPQGRVVSLRFTWAS